jgi:hypothetical protein
MPDTEVKSLRNQASAIATALKADAYLVYVTSTREPANAFGGSVALDVVPYLAEQLHGMGKKKRLALCLHTNGGDISAPWPLVSLLREYCEELQVVVINRALSAGTLISVAADSIVMCPGSFLSPIDPQAHVLINGQQRGVEVEDVTGYLEFAKSKAGLTGGAGLEGAFKDLTGEIPPTIIGSLFRTHALIRSLASKMLGTRKQKLDGSAEKQIIEHLTEKLFSHKHLISRSEAKTYVGLGDTILFAKGDLEVTIDNFATGLRSAMKLDQLFNPKQLLGSQNQYTEKVVRACLFSATSRVFFKSDVSVTKDQNGINVNVNDLGWVKEDK